MDNNAAEILDRYIFSEGLADRDYMKKRPSKPKGPSLKQWYRVGKSGSQLNNTLGKLLGASRWKRLKGDAAIWGGIGKQVAKQHKGKLMIAGGVLAAALIAFAIKKAKEKSKMNDCEKLSGNEKNNCLEKQTVIKKQLQVQSLNRMINLCLKSKDPKQCRSKIEQRIKELK